MLIDCLSFRLFGKRSTMMVVHPIQSSHTHTNEQRSEQRSGEGNDENREEKKPERKIKRNSTIEGKKTGKHFTI